MYDHLELRIIRYGSGELPSSEILHMVVDISEYGSVQAVDSWGHLGWYQTGRNVFEGEGQDIILTRKEGAVTFIPADPRFKVQFTGPSAGLTQPIAYWAVDEGGVAVPCLVEVNDGQRTVAPINYLGDFDDYVIVGPDEWDTVPGSFVEDD